jgi:hypothetical protein
MSEAAMLAGKDALQFRIDHTQDPRVKAVLERLRTESAWNNRSSPAKGASAVGAKVVRGRGVSMMLRDNGYWACAAFVAVTPRPARSRLSAWFWCPIRALWSTRCN